ncbi:MAG: hypothetical protein KGI97_04515 [Alphaproteobacteria bacterium]|nr:hypothetical protein [Alphaproteobacteria bacterium]
MIYSQTDLFKLLHDTRAVSIWNRAKGPVFWYAANVPGPFYVNTEMTIGADLSARLLREITAIVAGTVDAQARAEQLDALIMDAYKTSPSWQKLIATMIDKAQAEFPEGDFNLISGGERRDFLFSIPFAHASGLPHLFLFKNETSWCAHPLPQHPRALHVSDLINNAASILDRWLPALDALHIPCCGNLCINVRGDNGLKRLHGAGQKTACLATIDAEFFRHLHAEDLIDRETFEEIAVFFASAKDWAARYLIGKPELFDVSGCDAKSFERLRAFIANDPWKLRPQHEAFFADMGKAIARRAAKAA